MTGIRFALDFVPEIALDSVHPSHHDKEKKMAKIETPDEPKVDEELLVKAQNMNIHKFVPKRKEGKYDDEVQTLIAVDEASGEQNSIEILVPSEDEVKKYKKWFGESARSFGKSARIVNGDLGVSQGDGAGVILEFVLTEKVVRNAKPKEDSDEDTPTAA